MWDCHDLAVMVFTTPLANKLTGRGLHVKVSIVVGVCSTSTKSICYFHRRPQTSTPSWMVFKVTSLCAVVVVSIICAIGPTCPFCCQTFASYTSRDTVVISVVFWLAMERRFHVGAAYICMMDVILADRVLDSMCLC